MATLKSLAQARGVWLGSGPADPSVPTGPAIWVWPTVPPGYVWSVPAALDAATDPIASLIVNEFGGALDICVWARGPLDLSHWGKFERWLGPGSYDFDGPDQTYAWALANGLRVWVSDPAYSGVPAWLADWYDDGIDAYYIKNPAYSAADITNLLQAWYTAVFSRYPQIYATTLLNELRGGTSRWNVGFYYEHSSVGAAGGKTVNEFAATICSWVRAANPNVKIVPNDFGIEWNLANAQVQRDWILALNALGAGIADVGLQCHAGTTGTPDWTVFRQVAAMFKAAGLTPHVTEFDVKGSTASTFGDGIRAMLDSGITTINFWSIKDPMYTGTTGALYDTNLQPKAARASVEAALALPPTLAPTVSVLTSPANDEPITLSGAVPSFLAAEITGTATAAAVLTAPNPHPLAAALTGTASAAVALTVPRPLAASLSAGASVAADLTVAPGVTTGPPQPAVLQSPTGATVITIAGTVPGAEILHPLAGALSASASVSATLREPTAHPLSASLAAGATALVDLTHPALHPLRAELAGTATVQLGLLAPYRGPRKVKLSLSGPKVKLSLSGPRVRLYLDDRG